MNPTVRRRIENDEEEQRATTLELFYDLVFVFAITQVSHTLLRDLTWTGAGQAVVVLLVVHWSWNFTTWATNELDPDELSVRILLLTLMLGGLLLAIAIPEAFGHRSVLFAVSYVAIQLGRHGFLAFVAAEPGSNERERAGRILGWFAIAGALWIGGAIAGGHARTALWIAALVVDYGAPLITFWAPGRPHLDGANWDVTASHMAERFQGFVIIALGESIVVIGATAAGLELDAATVAGLLLAFIGSATFWWLYFTSVGRIAEESLTHSNNQTLVARDIYTYIHVVLIGGIVVSAVGDDIVLAHPTETLHTPELVALVAGPVLYLLAHLLIRLRIAGTVSVPRTTAITACVGAGLVGTVTPALVPAALIAAILVALVIHDEVGRNVHITHPIE